MDSSKVNPWERAAEVLQAVAWIEGPDPFPLKSAMDPQAVKSWGLCVDAVAGLPDEGGPLGITRRLKLRFSGTHSEPAGEVGGKVLWRWVNCPAEPWVSVAELACLRRAAAVWDLNRVTESLPAFGDKSLVNAGQLAAHADCTPEIIRRQLSDRVFETDQAGTKRWVYGAIVDDLRRWCSDSSKMRNKGIEWPNLASNLKNQKDTRKKK